jgi:hypothetical protein
MFVALRQMRQKGISEMAENMRETIRRQMLEKDTDELLQIWKENDRTEWTDTAFEVIREILLERTGSLPPQQEPEVASAKSPANDDEGDTYYNSGRFMNIALWAKTLSWLFLGSSILLVLLALYSFFGYTMSQLQSAINPSTIIVYSLVIPNFATLLFGALLFVLLQALGEGIYILMDIEDNTRRIADSQE